MKRLPHPTRSRCQVTGVSPPQPGKRSAALMKRQWRWQMAMNRRNARRLKFLKDLARSQPPKNYGKLCVQPACEGFDVARDPAQKKIPADSQTGRWKSLH